MSRNMPIRQVDPSNKIVGKVVDWIREEVKRRYGSELTFEQRRDAAVVVTNDSLWLDEERDLQSLVTHADEVEVEGKRYRRLKQPSSAEYRAQRADDQAGRVAGRGRREHDDGPGTNRRRTERGADEP